MHKSGLLLSLLLLVIFSSSCRHEPDLNSLKAVSFSNDIQPIIAGNCAMSGCHTDDSGSGGGHEEEAFSLTSYNDVMEHVEAGNAHKSNLYEAITNQGGEFMPPSPRPALLDDQIRLIYVWIEQGAKNN